MSIAHRLLTSFAFAGALCTPLWADDIDTGAYQADLYPEKNYALTLADLRVTAEDINKSQNNRRDKCIIILPGGQKP